MTVRRYPIEQGVAAFPALHLREHEVVRLEIEAIQRLENENSFHNHRRIHVEAGPRPHVDDLAYGARTKLDRPCLDRWPPTVFLQSSAVAIALAASTS